MPIDILCHLGKSLKLARKNAGLTQEELSERTNISTRHIAKIEKGVMNPSYEILFLLVNELGISADQLFNINMSEEDRRVHDLLYFFNSCEPTDRELIINVVELLSKELKKR